MDARVLFLGEAPGAQEDRVGRPFVGSSGRSLDAAIASLGLAPDEVGILNLIKCRPPHNRFDRNAWGACRPHLEHQLELLRPDWIVTLGANALRAFLPSARVLTGFSGVPILADGRRIYPMLHPAAMMHNPRLRPRWEQELEGFRQLLHPPMKEAL